MDVYCRSNISALNEVEKDTSVQTQPLIHTGMNTRIHSNTQKCSAITVNMHNLINIFARLQ